MDSRPAPALSLRLRIGRCIAALLTALAATLSFAQAAPAAASLSDGPDDGLMQRVRQLAQELSHAGTAGAPRIEVSIGELDPRLRLAPCQQVQPYVPEGMRMWGKSRIGVRCLQGPTKWNVYLPITVKAFGNALVASAAVASGSVLTAADLAPAEVDLAEDASPPVSDAALAVGRSVTRALKPGQSLRQSHLKARQWFAAGETVTVLAQGDGFSVAGEGQALNPGIEGQPVRVRTESGRVLTGQPVGERRVELAL
jgi:flagella basal body P-ring formation protein FlgA